jgi:hypothetical protein
MMFDYTGTGAPATEEVETWFGKVRRLIGKGDSSVLARLPAGIYPDPEPGCATCPAKDWYLTRNGLRCYCSEKNVVAWVSNDDPVMACDARERLIEEENGDD